MVHSIGRSISLPPGRSAASRRILLSPLVVATGLVTTGLAAGLAAGFLAGVVGWVVAAGLAVLAALAAAGTMASAKATKSDHTDFRTAASSLLVLLRVRRTY